VPDCEFERLPRYVAGLFGPTVAGLSLQLDESVAAGNTDPPQAEVGEVGQDEVFHVPPIQPAGALGQVRVHLHFRQPIVGKLGESTVGSQFGGPRLLDRPGGEFPLQRQLRHFLGGTGGQNLPGHSVSVAAAGAGAGDDMTGRRRTVADGTEDPNAVP
jgi:hypothetical protein